MEFPDSITMVQDNVFYNFNILYRKQRGRVGFDRHGHEGFCALESGLHAVHDIDAWTETVDSICSG